ncbi:hypothetical protein GCM10023314_03300 [Algibacter agarivorans]|uniref:Short chain dehydrogenase n=1 Tax=Algibacter agarivorans TaxID=1109741 RepID=A0ABP9GDA0_9FLAO
MRLINLGLKEKVTVVGAAEINALFVIRQIETAVKTIKEKYGRVDALINNVSIIDGIGLNTCIDNLVYSLKLNMVCFFTILKYCLPMIKKANSNILNIVSKAAQTGQGNASGYASSKRGLFSLQENRYLI